MFVEKFDGPIYPRPYNLVRSGKGFRNARNLPLHFRVLGFQMQLPLFCGLDRSFVNILEMHSI
jgi:hypothetical protein